MSELPPPTGKPIRQRHRAPYRLTVAQGTGLMVAGFALLYISQFFTH